MGRKLIVVGAVAFVAVASVAGATTAVADSAAGPVGTNLPPRVALASPADGFRGVIGCKVTFAAIAVDGDDAVLHGRPVTPDDMPIIADDGIDRVEFYLNDRLLASDDAAPYEVTVDRGPFVPAPLGKNTAFARAYDTDTPQLTAQSQTVSFLMAEPPPGQPGEPDQCLKATPPVTPPSPPAPLS